MKKYFLIMLVVFPFYSLYSENWEPFLPNFTYQYSLINKSEIITFTYSNPVTVNNNKIIYSHKYLLKTKNHCYDTLNNNSFMQRHLEPYPSLDSIIYNNNYIYLPPNYKISLLDSINTTIIISDTNKTGTISLSKYVLSQKLSTKTFNIEDSLIVIDRYDSNYYQKKLTYIGSIELSKKFGFIELLLPYDTHVLKLSGLSNGIETFGNYADTKSEIQKIIDEIRSRKIGDVIAWSIYNHPNFLNSVYRADSIVSVDFIDSVFIINTLTEEYLTNNGKDYNLIKNYFDRIIYDLKYLKAILESDTYSWILPPKEGLPYFKPINFDDYYKGMSVVHSKAPDMLLGSNKISLRTNGFGLYINPDNCIFADIVDEGNSITYDSKVGILEIDLGWDTMYLLGIKKSDGTVLGNFFKPNSVNEISDFSLFLSPNPVTEKLTLINIPDNATEFEIYDQFGNRQISGLISGQIDVSLLPAGVYFIKLNNSQRPLKFLKI